MYASRGKYGAEEDWWKFPVALIVVLAVLLFVIVKVSVSC